MFWSLSISETFFSPNILCCSHPLDRLNFLPRELLINYIISSLMPYTVNISFYLFTRLISVSLYWLQTLKCVDYFQAENGPREFGNICISTKQIQTTDTSLIWRCLEVKYKEVRLLLYRNDVNFKCQNPCKEAIGARCRKQSSKIISSERVPFI